MRDNGRLSMLPHWLKSISGIGATPSTLPETAALLGVMFIAALMWALTSSCVMRPLRPEPLTLFKSAPNSRANLRTEGVA